MTAIQQQPANRIQQPAAAPGPSLLEQVLAQPVGKRFKEIDAALQARIAQIEDVLPANMKGEGARLAKRAIMTLNRRADVYGEVSPASFVRCVLEAAEFGLAIDGRFAHAVPFTNKVNGKKVKEVELIFDYTGIVAVAKRNGIISDCWSRLIKQNDVFEIWEENGINNYKHKPALKDPGAVIGALGVVKLPDGSTRCEWMDMTDLNNVRARSQSWINGGGPWKTDDGEMRKKTVIRRAMKMYTDDQPQVSKMMELDDRDYQQAPRKPEPAPATPSNGHEYAAPSLQADPDADDAVPNPTNNNGPDTSEVIDDEAAQRAGMEIQDAIDNATNAEEMAAVKVKLDAVQEVLGDALYVAFLRMWRAKNKELGVK